MFRKSELREAIYAPVLSIDYVAERTQINIKVDTEQKKSWESFLEETDQYQTVTGLIRGAVHSEMNGESKNGESPPPALQNDLQDIRDRIKRVERDLAWLRNREQSDASIEDIAQEVYRSLTVLPEPAGPLEVPEGMAVDEYRKHVGAQIEIEPDSEEDQISNGQTHHTKQAIADRVGTEPDRIQDAINHLQEQLLPIVSVEYDGQTHYFREE